METATISSKSNGTSVAKPARAEERERFEDVLADVQAVQLAGTARLFAAPSGLEVRDDGEGESARQARVSQETQDARAAEVQANDTRSADPAAIEQGEVSSRRERILESKAEAAAKPEPTEKPVNSKGTNSKTQEPQLDAQASRGVETASAKPKTDALSANSIDDDKAAKAPAKAEATSSGSTERDTPRSGNTATVTVATAGAARLRDGAERASSDTPAKSVAKLLAGRGTAESVKTQAPSAGQGTTEKTATTQAKTNAATQGDRTAGETAGKESASSTSRTEFQRLVQSMRLNAGAKSSSATIRLDPPELGKVRVDVRMVDDVLRVRVEASSAQARELLSSRANELTAALREHAIEVRQFEVVDASQSHREQSGLLPEGGGQGQWGASQAGDDSSGRAFADSASGSSADGSGGEVEEATEVETQANGLDVRV